jgi:uncharacterized protein involved in oxidation of intracellular sulfur
LRGVDTRRVGSYTFSIQDTKEGNIVRELFIGTHGSENPTRATLPFLLAGGAIDAGHEPAIILAGDAAVLMSDTVVDSVQGVGLPPLKELMAKAVENKVPIHV